MKDIITWEYDRSGRLILRKDPQAHEEDVQNLLLHILSHYPEMAIAATKYEELCITATSPDHQLIVHTPTDSQ